ncbi:MAG: multidrug efflux RND transporter permease subunit [Rhodocyclaceae bacterium]|jgi:multidrug efflux pump|uniref:Efflux pump membrane transporter n=1 Tax=Candidatus Desulfobacillus denitrificans TaxID=2608985 RepID=A0A809RLB4_9PROT|nr:multidrug efflux RND transporter permease subunit [Candidatus Desulfobacillus denitrificans]GIK44646.1 MAG: multidrug efflux RND transporter permease subunit [Betaproteobacteria bacterium]GJQ54889.1 MAG: multidrug efflux RND transporter permease subunit [Rhodocyclaceae bacterium]
MIPSFFIDRPIFAWVIAIMIMLGGALSLRQLPVASYPEVAPPALAITVNYPGASAKVVEETAVALIEQELNGIENLLYMDSASEQNLGTITLTFKAGTNLDLASVETQNRIKRAEPRLPEEARRLGVTVVKSARNFLLFISLFSPDKSLDNVALGSYAAANVLESIRRTPGVGEAILFGTEYSMRLWIKPERLQAFGLTPADVAKAVRAQNAQIATGELGQVPATPGQEYSATIITQGRLATPEEFGNIIIRSDARGATVRVKDVARVELGAQDYTISARVDGQPNAAIAVRMAPGANALDTARAVKDRMGELARFFPSNISWIIPYDTSTFVDISISEVVKTLIEAMVLVVLVIYLFLENARATFIPAIVVPVSLSGALIGLHLLGYSINVLTLFAMVLAIAIVVDDAIVVIENVERIMSEEGLSPRAATRKAMGQIINAVIAITVVLTAVFVPLLFFGGSVGAIYRQFAVTLILTMAFSASMALSLTPALCASMLKHQPGQELLPSTGFFGWFNRFFAATVQRYVAATRRMLGRPGRWLMVFAAILAATGWLFARLPGSFLPSEDQGYFLSIVQLPAGATRERTLEVLDSVEKHYLAQKEVAHVIGVAGFSFFGRGQNAAIAFITLKSWDERPNRQNGVESIVQRANMAFFRIKQAMVFAINVPPIPELAAVGGFDFRLQDRGGLGRDKLMEARNMALGLAGQNPALAGVRPEGQEPAPQVFLSVDRVKARALGIDLGDLNDTLQATLGAAYINDFVRQGRILRVQMQAEADMRRTPEDLLRLPVKNASGDMIPLAEIATAKWIVGNPKLDRYNGLPSMKISGNPAPGRSTGEALAAMEEVAAKLPPGFGFEWSGTSYEERLSGSQAPFLFAVSLIVVFLCLAALYESWSIPFAVMLVVPLGIFGAVLAVTLRGLPNDVYFKVGLIAIIGLSAKNAILIIEFARELQEQGKDLIEATLEACRLRFRPILMTSIAFMFGVLPLAVSTGAGANSRHAIGTGVIGGMLTATVLAVFLVPVFFVVVRRFFPGHARHPAETSHD